MLPTVPLPRLPGKPLLALIAVFTLFRLGVAANIGLVFDEAYYRLWSLYPQWGYYDHAPMVAWWIALGRALVGDSALGVRLLGPLSAGVGALLLWRTALLLADRHLANLAVLIFNAMILPSVGSLVMTPDIPSVFFWGAALWALAELRHSGRGYWWLIIGLCAGLDLLSKYSGVFLGLGIGLWLLLDPGHRRWLTRPEPYLGGILALCLFLPVILWNRDHDYVSFAKQLARTQGEDFEPRFLGELIGTQFLLMTPIIGLFALGAFFQKTIGLLRHRDSPATLLIGTSLPFVLYLCLHSFHDRVNANWPAPLTPAFALLAAFAVTKTRFQFLRMSALPLAYALVLLSYAEIIHPFLPIPPERNPALLTRGWENLARDIKTLAHQNNLSYVTTATYEQTGALSFVLRDKMNVIQINERVRYGFMPLPDPTLTSKPALFISVDSEATANLKALNACVKDVERLGSLTRTWNGTPIESYSVYRLNTIRIDAPLYDRRVNPKRCLPAS